MVGSSFERPEDGAVKLTTLWLVSAKIGAYILASYIGPQHLGVRGGILFKGEGGRFQRVASLGVPPDAAVPSSFSAGEGLLGQVAAEGGRLFSKTFPMAI